MIVNCKGHQVDPDEWDASGMVADSGESESALIVRFGDVVTVTCAADVCARLGIALPVFHESMAALVADGFLELQPDGTYAASLAEVCR